MSLQFAPGFEFNIFDLQVGCEYPLPLERAFLQNFLLLATLPPDTTTPFEGMAQMISLVIDEAYRLCTEAGEGAKHYRPRRRAGGRSRRSTRYGIELHHEAPYWRDVVNALCDVGEYRLAERAQRHAVPILEDLIGAVRTDQVRDLFDTLKITETDEKASQTVRALHRRPDPPLPDAEPADAAGFRAGAHHRARPASRRPDRLGRRRPADRDDVPAGAAHPGPQLLPAPRLPRIRSRTGCATYHRQRFTEVYETVKRHRLRRMAPHRRAARWCARRPSWMCARAASTTCSWGSPASACPTWARASSPIDRPLRAAAPAISASWRRSSSASTCPRPAPRSSATG